MAILDLDISLLHKSVEAGRMFPARDYSGIYSTMLWSLVDSFSFLLGFNLRQALAILVDLLFLYIDELHDLTIWTDMAWYCSLRPWLDS